MGLDKIWVFGEANGDAVATITLEMLAKARELADTVEVFMAGDGDDVAEELGDHGADTVYATGDLDGAMQGVSVASASGGALTALEDTDGTVAHPGRCVRSTCSTSVRRRWLRSGSAPT